MSGSGVYQWVITIAGLAREHGSFASTAQRIRPMAMSVGGPARQTASASTLCDAYVACVIPGSVAFGSSGCNPLSGEFKSSTATFKLALNDAGWPEIGRFFLASQRVRRPVATQTTTVNPTSTTVTLVTTNGGTLTANGIVAGAVLYNRREAWRVQSVNDGTGVATLYDAMPSPTDYRTASDVARSTSGAVGRIGHIGTLEAAHIPRSADSDGGLPPVPDDRWYTSTPFVAGREVVIYRRDGDTSGPESVFWRGIISGNPEVDPDGLTVTVSCVDLLDSLRKRRFNTQPIGGTTQAIRVWGAERNFTIVANIPDVSITEARARTLWAWPRATGASSGPYFPGVFQLGKSGVYVGEYVLGTGGGAGGLGVVSLSNGSPYVPVLGGDPLPPDEEASNQKLVELLVSDPLDASSPLTNGNAINPADHPYYCEDVPDPTDPTATTTGILKHPLYIVLAHLGALDCPNLPAQWRLQMPSTYIDSAGVVTLARDVYASIDAWPGIVGGIDGKSVEAVAWLGEQLRSIGAALALTGPGSSASNGTDGCQITVRTLLDVTRTLNAQTVGLTQLLPGRPATLDMTISADNVIMEAGIGVNGIPALRVIGDEVYDSEFFPYQSSTYRFTGGGVIHPDDVGVAPLAYPRVQLVRRFTQTLATLFRFPLQLLSREVTYDTPIQAGEFLLVQDIGGRSEETGEAITAADPETKLVFASTVNRDTSEGLTQSATLLVMPFAVRRIGPAATATTGSSTTVINCRASEWIQLNPGEYTAAPGVVVQFDVETFEVGQKIVVVSASLEVLTDPATITAIDNVSTPKTITVGSALQAVGGGDYTPVDGDNIVLAQLTSAESTDVDRFAFIGSNTFTA